MPRRLPVAVLVILCFMGGSSVPAAQRSPGGPMRILLLVDSSNAMSAMLQEFRAGLNGFLEALPGDPEMTIVSTGGRLRVRVPATSDREMLRSGASGFSPDGGANMLVETLLEADQRFLKPALDQRPVVVILTTDEGATIGDVRVDAYNMFARDFVRRGGRAHAVVIQGVKNGMTTRIAEHLAHSTGGVYETVVIANAVPKLMRMVAEYVAADQ